MAYFYIGNVMASHSVADVDHWTVKLVVLVWIGQSYLVLVDNVIRQLHQHIVLVSESL